MKLLNYQPEEEKNKKPERMTCHTKLNPGPVNKMSTEAAQSIIKAIIRRVFCFKTGSGSLSIYFFTEK